MEIIAYKYTFSDVDRWRIESLGYHIEGIPPEEQLETFMPALFPNFDLAGVLGLVDRLFAPTTSLPVRRHIHYNVPKKILHFIFENTTDVLDDTVAFDRVVFWLDGEIIIEHRYCIVSLPYQGKGLIKPIFQESLQQYVNLGVRKVRVHAGFAGGGYTWARHGFVAINHPVKWKAFSLWPIKHSLSMRWRMLNAFLRNITAIIRTARIFSYGIVGSIAGNERGPSRI